MNFASGCLDLMAFRLESSRANGVSTPRAWQLCWSATNACCWLDDGGPDRIDFHWATGAATRSRTLAGSWKGSKWISLTRNAGMVWFPAGTGVAEWAFGAKARRFAWASAPGTE